ncbi:hypothetical protein [Bacteroides nordii]|uniref:DUF1871 family protein n=1 Tax=Bacteroides nordii TaxID=291645 RepID=A0A413VWA1_9BACE|nr:hypothetical protein [Bacteroides nordii]RHB37813.1 hypothetical protein DW888_04415 [Bacteroides nordii]
MNELTNKINDILTKWDPIGVGEEMAMDEYKEYIPMIIHYAQDRQKLINHLEKILVDYMGLSYDPYNQRHFEEIQNICDKLIEICKNQK